MIDRISERPALPDQEVKAMIGELARLPLVKDQLNLQNARWLARPGGTSLDLGFVLRGGGCEKFVAVDIVGERGCVGIKVVGSEEERLTALEQIGEEPLLTCLIERGAQIAVVTREELGHWVGYYRQVKREKLTDELGKKAYVVSGLRRASERDVLATQTEFERLISENWELLFSMGVAEIRRGDRLDIEFVNDQGELVAVPLFHVRTGQFGRRGELLEEKVSLSPLRCPGFVLRGIGENKRSAYQRADQLLQIFGDFDRVAIPVLSPGQISLFRKLGMLKRREAILGGSSLSADDLIGWGYLGESNLVPGDLAINGLSLPGSGEEFGIDIIFYRKDARGERALTKLDNVLGFDFKGKNGPKLRAFDNVAGLLIVPSDWSTEQVESYRKDREYDIFYRGGKRTARIVCVTEELFNIWRDRGTIFVDPGEVNETGPGLSQEEQKPILYGPTSQTEVNELLLWRTGAEIGGMKMAISTRVGGETRLVILDFGTSYTTETKGQSGLTSRSPSAFGVLRDIFNGKVPVVREIIAFDYLLQSARCFPGLFDGRNNHPIASFLRAELARRVDYGRLVDVFGKSRAKKIIDLSARDVAVWYPDDEHIILEGIVPSHAHNDHIGEVPVLREDAPVFASTETAAHMWATDTSARSWRERPLTISMLTAPKAGSAYQVIRRELVPIHFSGESVKFSSIKVQQELVNHSITGACMTFVQVNGKGVLYTGDLKMGERTREAVRKMAGRAETIVMETTNFDDGEVKASSGISETQVKATIAKIVAENSGNPIAVIIPTNHLERLSGIIEVARLTGRKLAVCHKLAETVRQQRAAKLAAPSGVVGFDFPLPEIGADVALWTKPTLQLRKYQQLLVELAYEGNLGIVDQQRFGKERGDWIVIISPFDLLQHNFGGTYFGSRSLVVIHSAPFPYEQDAKYLVGTNLKWINSLGGKFYIDSDVRGEGGRVIPDRRYGLHASGHVTFNEMTDEVLVPLLGDNWSGKQIIIVHGQHPVTYERALRGKLGLDPDAGLEIISRLTRYDPTNPLRGGYRLRLV